MNTDELIRRLATDARPARTVADCAALSFAPALVLMVILLVLGWGVRADFVGSLANPVTALKLLLPALVALAAVAGALQLARPGGSVKGAMVSVLVLAGTALGLVVFDLARTPAAEWGEALRGRTLVACLLSIPALAVLPTLALLFALRNGASLAPASSGALAGLGGGAAAAALYALHCDEDAPLFYVTWYGVAIIVTVLLGAALGRRLLRW